MPGAAASQKPSTPLQGGAPTRNKNRWGFAILIFCPWTIFVVISFLFTFVFHQHQAFVWALVVLCVALSTISMMAVWAFPRIFPFFYLFVGVLCLFSSLVATMAGYYNYQTNVATWWSYEESRVYTNLLPSKRAETHSDAGLIMFSKDAKVETTKAVGYKASSIYCVAPIIGTEITSQVNYWAAGIDCCEPRGDFTCDQAGQEGVHGGAVLFDTSSLAAPSRPEFLKAAKEASAAYGIASAEDPLFVRWMADPQVAQDEAWSSAMAMFLGSISIDLCISVLFALALCLGSSPRSKW